MSYEPTDIVIRVWTSADRGERERRHDRLAADLVDRVQQLAADPKYAELRPEVNP